MSLGKVLGKRVLLVEDEPNVRSAIKMLLTIDQHKVIEAENGREALELWQREGFDLIITDFAMPLMQGDELAATIHRLKPAQPIIMITAYRDDLMQKPVGVGTVLGKPFDFEELRNGIARALTASPIG